MNNDRVVKRLYELLEDVNINKFQRSHIALEIIDIIRLAGGGYRSMILSDMRGVSDVSDVSDE